MNYLFGFALRCFQFCLSHLRLCCSQKPLLLHFFRRDLFECVRFSIKIAPRSILVEILLQFPTHTNETHHECQRVNVSVGKGNIFADIYLQTANSHRKLCLHFPHTVLWIPIALWFVVAIGAATVPLLRCDALAISFKWAKNTLHTRQCRPRNGRAHTHTHSRFESRIFKCRQCATAINENISSTSTFS